MFNFQYTVKKVDRQTGAALQGAEFTIYRGTEASEANRIGTQITGDDGLATFEGLDAGKYTIKETGVPEDYINSNVQFTVTITPTYNGKNENMTVTNVDYVISGVEIGQPDAGLVSDVTEGNASAVARWKCRTRSPSSNCPPPVLPASRCSPSSACSSRAPA